MACGFVGAAEGSPFFPNLFLADRDSRECWSWVRRATGCRGGGGGCSEPRRERGLLWAWLGCTSCWEPEVSLSRQPRPSQAKWGEYNVNTRIPPALGFRGWDLSVPGIIPNPSTRGPEPQDWDVCMEQDMLAIVVLVITADAC